MSEDKGFGGGGSRSATIVEFSNDFESAIGSIGEKRQKAVVQVQNRYSESAGVSSMPGCYLQKNPLALRRARFPSGGS
jgi:hypothetical protein